MKLLTKKIKEQIPPLYSQDGKGKGAIAYVRFFSPWSSWEWFGTEFDGKDTFFGLVKGAETELGYFSLSELQKAHGFIRIERDMYFKPTELKNLI